MMAVPVAKVQYGPSLKNDGMLRESTALYSTQSQIRSHATGLDVPPKRALLERNCEVSAVGCCGVSQHPINPLAFRTGY